MGIYWERGLEGGLSGKLWCPALGWPQLDRGHPWARAIHRRGPCLENGLTAGLGRTGAAGVTGGKQPQDSVALAPTRDSQREDVRSVL